MNKSKDSDTIREKTYSYISADNSGTGMIVVPLTELFEPKDTEELNGVIYRRTNEVHIDVNLIPDHVRDSLTAATLEAYKRWMNDPESRKVIKERSAAKKARERSS